ncbi:MAG: TOBE domain-containing protein [Chloroflexota bacterium]|nr:TOBE domain-containing protein [Chloroflexota bacterium]
MPNKASDAARALRIGAAAELLDVSVATLRRWEAQGRIRSARSAGGQRTISLAEVERLRRARRASDRAMATRSARNRFEGVVTRIERDKVAALVEVLAGPHRVVSLVTREAVDDMKLEIGDEVVAVVKATNVMIELREQRYARRRE